MKRLPKNETVYAMNKDLYVITRHNYTGIWSIYSISDEGEYTKLGTGNNPLKLENKFFNIGG